MCAACNKNKEVVLVLSFFGFIRRDPYDRIKIDRLTEDIIALTTAKGVVNCIKAGY
jgi:hypothetical protein